jgi:hypothetical protein
MQRAQRPIVARPPQSLPFESSISVLGLGEPADLGGGLAAIPVLAPERGWDPVDARLFTDSPPAGVEITEVNGGTVPVLHVRNGSDAPLFLVAGQLMRGGMQNRGLNADALIVAGATIAVPVTCVEAGRWSGDTVRAPFSAGGMEPSHIRSMKHDGVSESRRRAAARATGQPSDELAGRSHGAADHVSNTCGTDQDAVWRSIEGFSSTMGVRSRSRDLLESIAGVERGNGDAGAHAADDDPRPAAAGLPACNARTGLLFFLDGNFVGGDVFACNGWSASLEPELVRSVSASRDFSRVRMREFRQMGAWPTSMGPHDAWRHRLIEPERLLEVAQCVVGDALRGRWSDGATVGAERSMLLAHPFIAATATSDGTGRLLHMQLNAVRPPWSFGLN